MSRKRAKVRRVRVPRYERTVFFVVGTTAEEINKRLKVPWFSSGRKGCFAWDEDSYEMGLLVVDRRDMGTMCHESVHAAMHVLEVAGVKVATDDDEALAYLTQWFFEQLMASR